MTSVAGRNFWSLVFLQCCSGVALLAILFWWPVPWDFQRKLGCVIAIASMGLLATARYQLGRSFSITPQARILVTHGIYSRIRNPIYVFSALMIAGLVLVLHRPMLWLIFVLLVPMQIARARKEARVLEKKFGEEYLNYRRNTWF